MKKLWLLALKLTVVAAFATVATLPLAAQDRDAHRDWIKGTYFATGDNGCLLSPAGFYTDPGPTQFTPEGPSLVQSSSVQGTLKINPDGTGSGEFEELIITHPPATSAGASSSKYSVPFTYTVAEDGTLTVVFGTLKGELLTGSSAGLCFTLSPPPLTGRITRDKSTMLLSNTDPTVETLTLMTCSGVIVKELPRICHRSRVLVRVHAEDED
jgi:hypothetical protein